MWVADRDKWSSRVKSLGLNTVTIRQNVLVLGRVSLRILIHYLQLAKCTKCVIKAVLAARLVGSV